MRRMPSFHGKRSELATTHRLSNRTVLLPFEAELCNSVGITKEEYFEFNGEVKPQNKIELANEKKYQDLFDEIEEKCLSGKLTSIEREIDL